MRTLALIPAREGSKGLPGKNRRTFAGKPLVFWALEIGKQTCDYTYLSTDDPEVAMIGIKVGADLLNRPRELAQDDTPMIAVLQHALRELRHLDIDVLVLLQPTSPLRTKAHVEQALRLLVTKEADAVCSVVKVPQHCAPDYVGVMYGDRIVFPATTRRQDTKPAFYRDGTVYVTRAEFIREGSLYGHKCIPMIIPREESATIDAEVDFLEAMARA